MPFRRIIFWTHLVCGIVAGLVIAIMSFTGVIIAFEHEVEAWFDRGVTRVEAPADARQLGIDELRIRVTQAKPGFVPTSVIIPRAADEAWTFVAGREGRVYVDPFTGEVREPRSHGAHAVMHELIDWHRWLGMEGDGQAMGKLITGVCNAAFLGLCVTGLYLWWPRAWSGRALRPVLWFVGRYKGRARDYNWHNVLGLWSAPVLIVLVATGVVISFGWAHDLVFRIAGEEPPKFRDFRMMAVKPPGVPAPDAGAVPLPLDAIVARLVASHPYYEQIGVNFPRRSPSDADLSTVAPLDLVVFEPAPFQTAGRVQVYADPFTGDMLTKVAFGDRSPGLRARVWVRFLHTGEAFGLAGKVIAVLATAASLVLVYTGFALSWRRFVVRKSRNAGCG
ncbi:MAG: PepSY domain-containing protein [Opitutaceae bacterium]|nr:PepSY domain-containing protein [Opitutaceae bacterium]